LKLSELLLLLLRCLLLIVLAVVLSKPFYEKKVDVSKEKGWVLIERKSVKEAYNKFKQAIDSLLKAGYSFHYFNKGFPEAKFEDALKMKNASVKENHTFYWTLLKELNQQVPAKFPVFLFTDNSLSRFKESRPNIALNLKWNTYASNDTGSVWVEKATEISNDSIRVVLGNSNSNGIYYTSQNLSQQTSNERFDVSIEQGNTIVSFKDNLAAKTKQTAQMDTTTVTIFIYTDKFGTDANYVKAALDAISDFTKRKIKTTVVSNVERITGNYDWLFWLSENEMPPSFAKGKVFMYEKGKVFNVHSNIIISGNLHNYSSEDLQLFKMIENKSSENFYPVWKNGYGDALLNKSNDSVYHFYSRFNPQWNSLPWSNEFPQIIYKLVFDETDGEHVNDQLDKRIIDAQQIQPAIVDEKEILQGESLLDKNELTNIFWLIAFILFITERVLTFHKKKREVYG
ncbi:MAG: hypothetical protein M3352_12190, partial [Bacteroidota bacterium]|nr:hypothetical protein [Bacteroidota bacterium]